MNIVMRGRIEEVDLRKVLEALCLSRLYSVVSVVDDGGQPVGTLALKSGMVVTASSRDGAGLPALRELMRVAGGDFQVAQMARPPEMPSPLGPLTEILGGLDVGPTSSNAIDAAEPTRAPRSEPAAPIALPALPATDGVTSGAASPIVMRGALTELDLAGVLQVVSLSRQYNVVQVKDDDDRFVGTVELKAGVVIAATALEAEGLPAMALLLRSHSHQGTFEVTRPAAPASLPKPLGPLGQVLVGVIPMAAERAIAPDPRSSPMVRASFPPPPGVNSPRARPPTRVLCVASAKGGVGKTTIALHTAIALARAGLRVVLIEGDPSGGITAMIDAPSRDADARVGLGALDVLADLIPARDAIAATSEERLAIMPAGGVAMTMDQVESALADVRAWSGLLAVAGRDADLVVLDAPPGLTGVGRTCLRVSTDVLLVWQAEPNALRAFDALARALASLETAPKLAGVVVNGWDPRPQAALAALEEAKQRVPAGSLLEPLIPRHAAFSESRARAVRSAPTLTRLLDALAGSIRARLDLGSETSSLFV